MAGDERQGSVLVTGCDRGIGLGLTGHYLNEGCRVVATSRRTQAGDALAALAAAHPDRLTLMRLDAGDEGSIAAFGKQLDDAGVVLDLVINNAGVSLGEAFGQWTADHFATHFMVNTVGPSLVVQAVRSRLRPGSTVIQMTSGMASAELNIGADNPLDAYAASKCGLNILTRRLAEKLRAEGVAVVAMSPGWVQTEMGGAGATTPVADAVAAMTATIAGLGADDSGRFIGPDGAACPW